MRALTRRDWLLLLLLCAVVFFFRLGRLGLIDPDEPFYALTAREMLARHDWLVPHIFGQPQFEKPILFYWLSAASFRLLGQTEFAARLPAALFATLLCLLTAAFGARTLGRRTGLLAGVMLATTLALAGTTRLMLTDVVFACFLTAACAGLFLAADDPSRSGRWVILALAASALAVLTKGPLGILVPALALAPWLASERRRVPGPAGAWIAGLLLFAVIALPWYALMLARFGDGYVRAFFVHENWERLVRAEHRANNRPDYYPLVLLLGSIPWLAPMAATLGRARRALAAPGVTRFLWTWILANLAFFTLAQSKLPTYILFLFVPLALLLAREVDRWLESGFGGRVERGVAIALAGIQAVALLAAAALPGYRALAPPVLAAGACLGAAALLLVRRPSPAWVAASAAGTVALLIAGTTISAPALEALLSVRPATARVAGSDSARPVLSSAFLVRGVTWYTDRPPGVISNRPQPFWTRHPVPVVQGLAALPAFVREHGATFCITRVKEWHDLERVPHPTLAADSSVIGDKQVMRIPPADP